MEKNLEPGDLIFLLNNSKKIFAVLVTNGGASGPFITLESPLMIVSVGSTMKEDTELLDRLGRVGSVPLGTLLSWMSSGKASVKWDEGGDHR